MSLDKWLHFFVWFIPPLLSVLIAVPLHSYIIFRLLTNKNLSRLFAWLVSILCSTDILVAFLHMTASILHLLLLDNLNGLHFIFIANYLSLVCFNCSAFLVAILSIYWKHAVAKNNKFDAIMLILTTSVTLIFFAVLSADFIINTFIMKVILYVKYFRYLFWLTLICVSFICFVLVLQVNSNQLSVRNGQLLRKMAIGLLCQTIFNMICFVLVVSDQAIRKPYSTLDRDVGIASLVVFLANNTVKKLSPLIKAVTLWLAIRKALGATSSPIKMIQASPRKPTVSASIQSRLSF